MQKKLELTPRAERDLKDIWIYTAKEWGFDQADNYHALFEKHFKELLNSPFMGAERPDLAKGYRYFPVGKHLIFYRIEKNNGIVILGVLHASMDIGEQEL